MNPFDYYTAQELKDIRIDGKQPQDMTRTYDADKVVNKKLKKKLKGENEVFVVSTEFKNPRYVFSVGQEVIVDFGGFEEEAVCFGREQNAIRGIRCFNYFFQIK
ncbi:hypothetical protein [Serratia marcescens]|uniref:hypothetical protein n=1 Tax=Serratia marcescens TaxID=615 RepID=UPI001F15063A|nr:hypothetical protein [Serratia marcescens]MDP8728374.1 hypothetical protein [Serratia marcescens]